MSDKQPKFVPINSELHNHLKVKANGDFAHAAKDHLVLVNVREFVSAAAEFPIVFVKEAKSGEFVSTAIMGLQDSENLYCGESPWACLYTPKVLFNYPFSVALQSEDSDQVAVLIDENSELVNAIDGENLFGEDGKETEYLQSRARAVVEFMEEISLTKSFLKMMVEMELITQQDLVVNTSQGSQHNINGIYIVDEKKLNELDDEAYLKLRQNGSLTAIYAHLLSLRQINRVARRHFELNGTSES